MVQNVVSWDSEWQHAQKLADSLRQSEKNGGIQRLCLMPGCRACFRSEERADKILYDLSWLCEGKVISHEWLDGEDCGSCLWQDGRKSECIPPRESPEWYHLTRDVTDKVKTWETCAAFHDKLDSCWDAYLAKCRGLSMSQIQDRAVEIMATVFCYGRLSALSWHKSWIALLNLLDDPLETVRDAWIAARGADLERNFEFDLSYITEKIACERRYSCEVEQSQSL